MVNRNKGEWSETLALGQIVFSGRLPVVDADLNKLNVPDLVITAVELDQPIAGTLRIPTASGMPSNPANNLALLQGYLAGLRSDLTRKKVASFSSVSGESLLAALNASGPRSKKKADLTLEVALPGSPTRSKLGYSIKSHAGAKPTLLNASQHTLFTYRVNNAVNFDFAKISQLKLRQKLALCVAAGMVFEPEGVKSQVLKYNLEILDGRLEEDLGHMLLAYYLGTKSNLTDQVANLSARQFDPKYAEKLKFRIRKLLEAVALGMVPGTNWNTRNSVYGGYVIVKNDQSIVTLPLLNGDVLGDYLFKNSKFDTPSTTRHNFGSFYSNAEGELFIDLCLQIRFT